MLPTSRRRSTRGTRGLLSRISSVVAKAQVVAPLRPARPQPRPRLQPRPRPQPNPRLLRRLRPASASSAKVRSLTGHRPTHNQANRLQQQTTMTTPPASPSPAPTRPPRRKRRRPRRLARSRSRRPKPTKSLKKSLQGAWPKRSRPMRPASSSPRATSGRRTSSRLRCSNWNEMRERHWVWFNAPVPRRPRQD